MGAAQCSKMDVQTQETESSMDHSMHGMHTMGASTANSPETSDNCCDMEDSCMMTQCAVSIPTFLNQITFDFDPQVQSSEKHLYSVIYSNYLLESPYRPPIKS